ncbi:MAG: DNA polymerase III subunit gamma/tau [Pseudomonadales bacterium]|nr:DNA polymerase III subunit gamma/tau [Pseudomonadales bacterium]NRA14345.1 DNA polymerase III subunit gamma/tau [Oceanospirillaceae bacterium]
MSYQVLARKWRPKQFTEMVGQEHVLKALINALDDNRLHHAYLFTGTRGVGKTSIARLFAKALNCEQGVSSKPCGTCSACCEIAEGRFVDLIEVDAASRTKVEDTRELLENVQYAPSRGRFKVYLIDEVHMLSKSSFNALLKTLEEPPPHVKFLLATTDPQKLPVTVLSRCLQFNLKNMIPQRIVEHLKHVLSEEQVPFEEAALWLLARSADGSMRDALSLTDQSIAFGAGAISENDVRVMLGTIDLGLVYEILIALVAGDGLALLNNVADLAQFSPDYNNVLGDIVSLLHRVAIAQTVPAALDNSMGDKEQVSQLAKQLSAEDVQLFYQIALMGRKDLPFVPDAREGLEMTLMRMLAFRPAQSQHLQPKSLLEDAKPDSSNQDSNTEQGTTVSAGIAEQVVNDNAIASSSNETVALAVVSATVEKKDDLSAGPVTATNSVMQAQMPEAAPVGSQAVTAVQAPSHSEMTTSDAINDMAENHQSVHQPAAEPSAVAEAASVDQLVTPPMANTKTAVLEPITGSSVNAINAEKKTNTATEEADNLDSAAIVSNMSHPAPVAGHSVVDLAPWEDQNQAYQQTAAVEVAASEIAVQVDDTEDSAGVSLSAPSQINISQFLDAAVTDFAQLGLDDWPALVGAIGFTGMTAHIAENLSLESIADSRVEFNVSKVQKNVLDTTQRERIQTLLSQYFNREITVSYDSQQSTRETPWQCFEQLRAKRLRQAIASFQGDQLVQQLVSVFSAEIDRSSIMPVD